jgi:hypothetical protein
MHPDEEEEEPQRRYPSIDTANDKIVAWIQQDLSETWNTAHMLADRLNRGQGARELALCITKIEEALHRINDVKRELGIKKFLET